jgi:hypothetical protein
LKYAFFNQRRYYPSSLQVTCSDNIRYITARKFSTIQYGFQYIARLWRQPFSPHFFFNPNPDALTQLIGLNEALHKCHLIDTGLQEELGEFSERSLTPTTSAVEISTSWLVTRD